MTTIPVLYSGIFPTKPENWKVVGMDKDNNPALSRL